MALVDGAVPAVVPESRVTDPMLHKGIPDADFQRTLATAKAQIAKAPDTDILAQYLCFRPSENPATIYCLRRSLSGASVAARTQLGQALSLLSTRAGALLFTGYATPLHEQPIHVREAILKSWSDSWIPTKRLLFKTFNLLAKSSFLVTNPLYSQVSGYPDKPDDWVPGEGFDFNFIQFDASPDQAVLETDVVIVGSGCGGGVAAKVLAEAGHKVLVVDKGYYFHPEQLPMPQAEGMYHLFENGGFITSTDSSIACVAGSSWGGGGTINWSVSLQTQGYVRREWAEEKGLDFFATQEYQDCLDRVCKVMGVDDAKYQSHRGQVLLDGARKLGWDARPAPQNCGGREHPCGHCHLGCASTNKQGPAVSWLPGAARNGARFVEGMAVDRVLFDEESGEKIATGIIGRWTSRDKSGGTIGPDEERVTREVLIRAKKVIVSTGSLQSPLLLKRSGLKNRHIGRNLHLHPVNFVIGYYEEDVRPWEGGIITSLCTSFENLDNHGHGVKLEGMCMVPYTLLSNLVCDDGLDFKLTAARLRHAAAFISLARDRDTGSVFADPCTGKPCIDYTPSAFDAAHVLEGVIALAKICYITGAKEIRALLPGTRPFVRKESTNSTSTVNPGVTDPDFVAWLAAVRAAGNKPPMAPFSSAHQMGSCRMSSSPSEGVVDPRGKAWETEGLFVADASVFPSASGVNPMVTNMAIADWIARGVSRELKEGR